LRFRFVRGTVEEVDLVNKTLTIMEDLRWVMETYALPDDIIHMITEKGRDWIIDNFIGKKVRALAEGVDVEESVGGVPVKRVKWTIVKMLEPPLGALPAMAPPSEVAPVRRRRREAEGAEGTEEASA